MNAVARPKRIGDLLIEKGILTQDQLSIALTEQKKSREQLGKIIVSLGFATEAVVRDALGEALGQESVDLAKVIVDTEVLQLVGKDVARRFKMLPLSIDSNKAVLTVAMADTFNVVAIDQLRALLGGELEIMPVLAGESEIETAIDQLYGFELSVDGILHEIETGQVDYSNHHSESDEYSQPLVRLVDALLSDAVKKSASDIHFEPELGFLRIRYRVDGVLRQVRSLHQNYWSAIAVRLKVISGMNIAETRAPQDGHISLTLFGRPVDFRVSAQPTTHGENIVLRILDRNKGIVPLDKLGLSEHALATLRLMMARPEGILLVTGPTGSGKTTTLYSMLSYVNDESVNIMTLEDPVEYPMPMIRQTSVNVSAKLDFASGIRSMLRQDPDIILVGEVRDEDTADMALRAAMTGHQVYSTLHTNSAVGAIPRLLDLGIVPDILAGNIIGIVAQRLIRKLCPHCRKQDKPTELEHHLLGLAKDENPVVYRADGCEQCHQSGYRGRIAITELLKVDTDIDDLIARRASRKEIHELAISKGFEPIAEDALRRVLDGSSTLEEVSRVVDLTDRL
ncbi:general secretion pathway protein E/type IV pilus assembly protein PilB [Thiogranum longum]|uniref:General secretion pathway protein E/type IV pilus assembly protein PilB n=1 Tax=Thiogranum longum TaxID=1537524 RepID=A0A4R1H6S6_9GAMM|nr:GspE/PulE family protein [Thiogranum longum]TCK16858.1 general secretion pathway protein E/type IV pilus assembly protein PilB [Thiogranum longum]